FGILPFSLQISGLQFLLLLAVLPTALLIGSGVWGFFYGFDIICPLIAGLLFVFPVYLFMNDSALIYMLVYGLIALAGIGIGSIIQKSLHK
ncbi:MAG: hypothetical protein RSC76_09190, partial [Oscillospiraceae bacterium]